ncbi:MAG TPA: amidohydrolase family protein, partial [Blastocatellia bacterium]|nr:amidohydrolase family protein [Blastocatellia bacterium]
MTGDRTDLIIDAWAQPALPRMQARMPEIARLFKQSGSSRVMESGISTEETVEAMDRAGIQKLMLSAWHRPGQWVIRNDEVAEVVSRFPGRFEGVAAVNLEKPVEAVRELDRAVKELGFKALRVVPWLWGRPPNDKLYFPLYVKCVELDIPFCTQVGHTGPLMPSETGRPV